MHEARKFRGTQLCGVRVRCSAHKCSEMNMALRRAVGKERGIPDRAENAKPCRTRNQKTEPFERMADIFLRIAERNDGNCRVLDCGQKRFERRIDLSEQLSSYIRWRCKNHILCRHRIVAATFERNVK